VREDQRKVRKMGRQKRKKGLRKSHITKEKNEQKDEIGETLMTLPCSYVRWQKRKENKGR